MPDVFNFICEVFLNPTRTGHPLLPIAIDHDLPQVQLKFGLTDSDESVRPSVCGIVDSGASLCTGNLLFFTALCKVSPHIVEGIIVTKVDGFAPICLRGVVNEDDKEATTMELPNYMSCTYLYLKAWRPSSTPSGMW